MNFYDNTVYFNVNKTVQEADVQLLDLYFQSSSESFEVSYNKRANVLVVSFLENEIKQMFLKQKKFAFKSYEFTAFEQEANALHGLKIHDTVIVENFNRSESLSDLNVFFNNLVPDNKIKRMEYSKIYENVIYVKFEGKSLDFEGMEIKIANCPFLKNKCVQVHEAFETNLVMLKLHSGKTDDFLRFLSRIELIRKECHLQVPFGLENSPFVILKFKDMLTKMFFMMNTVVFEAKNYLIEDIINLNVCNTHLNRIHSQQLLANEIIDQISLTESTEPAEREKMTSTIIVNQTSTLYQPVLFYKVKSAAVKRRGLKINEMKAQVATSTSTECNKPSYIKANK